MAFIFFAVKSVKRIKYGRFKASHGNGWFAERDGKGTS